MDTELHFRFALAVGREASRRSLTKALSELEAEKTPFTLKAVFDELVHMESKDNVGLLAKIEAILVSDFGEILNSGPDGLTLSKIRKEKACLYIRLSTQGYGETATSVGKLFLGELLYNSYKTLSVSGEEGLKNPVSIYFDEFGSLVTPEFIGVEVREWNSPLPFKPQRTLTELTQTSPDKSSRTPEIFSFLNSVFKTVLRSFQRP